MASMLHVAGDEQDPWSGRIWVRRFGDSAEVLYRSARGPSESEKLTQWMNDAGHPGSWHFPRAVGYGPSAPRESAPEDDRERAARRARQQFRFKLKAISADRMLTLTHRENVEDFEASRQVLQKFLARCRREWSRWLFVGVPERQARGAWHWHLAVPGWVNVDKLRAFWWRAHGRKVAFSEGGKPVLLDGGETPGNIDVKLPKRSRSRRTWDPDRLSGYLCKYLSKDLGSDEATAGRASYVASRGITWTTERYAVRALTFESVVGVVFDVLEAAGMDRPYLWQSPDRAVLWASGLCPRPAGD